MGKLIIRLLRVEAELNAQKIGLFLLFIATIAGAESVCAEKKWLSIVLRALLCPRVESAPSAQHPTDFRSESPRLAHSIPQSVPDRSPSSSRNSKIIGSKVNVIESEF